MLGALSPLAGSLIVIFLVWITAIIIGQITKYSLLKALENSGDENTPVTTDSNIGMIIDKRIRIKKGVKVFNIAVSAISAVTFLVFVLFLNNLGAGDDAQTAKIHPAPLPENFQPPTSAEIEKSNEKSVTQKAEKVQKQAAEENTKAMNNAINIFKKAK